VRSRFPCNGSAALRFRGASDTAFQNAGWVKDRQHGRHVVLVKPGNPAGLSVPLHRELAPALRSLIRASGMTVMQFMVLLWGPPVTLSGSDHPIGLPARRGAAREFARNLIQPAQFDP
jgi:predicted RNA binding protein YcfA (HicA-like mRNA interferase family)